MPHYNPVTQYYQSSITREILSVEAMPNSRRRQCACLSSFGQATVLEEMPPFPERESSILAKLKKKQPGKMKETMEPREVKVSSNHTEVAHIPEACTHGRLIIPKTLKDLSKLDNETN